MSSHASSSRNDQTGQSERSHPTSVPRTRTRDELSPEFRRDDDDQDAANSRRLGKRRGTDADRQKVEYSCDRCRQRKRRCMRIEENASCVACEEAGAECITTQTRKQRIYATVDQLSVRYRVLDSLIRGLYPDHDVDSLKGLLALAKDKSIDLPRQDGRISPLDPTASLALAEGEHASSFSMDTFASPASFSVGGSGRNPPGQEDIPEGWLVPAPRGGYHYVGTASLVYFANTVRLLVAKSNLSATPSFDDAGLRRFMKAAEFTTYKASHTIEAKISGHPTTVAAEKAEKAASPPPTALAPFSEGIPTAESTGVSFSPSGVSQKSQRESDYLPDISIMNRLVEAFFAKVHPNFAIFHPGEFQVRYEETCAAHPDPTLFSRNPGWLASLHMVLVLGAQTLEQSLGPVAYAIQQRSLFLLFREGLGRMITTTSLSSVQALMLLSLYQHNAGERNAAWLLLGHAARVAIALGMHRDGENGDFNPFERNARRLVWWTLNTFEQFLSLALGRPAYTDRETIGSTTSLPEATYLQFVGQPQNYLVHSIELTRLWTAVRRFIASISSHYESPERLNGVTGTAYALLDELARWRAALPPHLRYTSPNLSPQHRRSVFLMNNWADYIQSILTRPYLLAQVNWDVTLEAQRYGAFPEAISSLARVCVNAAKASAEKLLQLAQSGLLDGVVSLDFYAVQHATMIIGLYFLGRPNSLSPQDVELKRIIATLLDMVKSVKLAPTYKITMNVAIQLAYIAGIELDTIVVPVPAPFTVVSPTVKVGQTQDEANPMAGYTFPPSSSIGPTSNGPTHDFINHPPLNDNLMPVMSTGPGLSAQPHDLPANVQYNTIEHLFGPMPPSRHNSAPDIFADLYNFGLGEHADNPWDFFNVSELTQAALQAYNGQESNDETG